MSGGQINNPLLKRGIKRVGKQTAEMSDNDDDDSLKSNNENGSM